jgi:two-component system chemotaxis sensor kinase CheA
VSDGRGRASIEQVGGSVDVVSSPGQGTSFRLNVPLTLAIMPVLVSGCGGGRYAVPQVHLREVIQLDEAELADRVDVVEDARLLRLRGRLLPLVDLAGLLDVEPLRSAGSSSSSWRPTAAASGWWSTRWPTPSTPS